MSNYSKALNKYVNLFTKLLQNNITTNEALIKSAFYNEFGSVSLELAKAIITIKYKDIEHIEHYSGFNYDDWTQELAVKLTKNFETTMKAIVSSSKSNEAHSYGAYTFSTFDGLLKDTLKGLKNYYIKEKVPGIDSKTGKKTNRSEYVMQEDENGIKHKAKYPIASSLDAPISTNDSENECFIDQLFDFSYSAEELFLLHENNYASLHNIASYVMVIGNNKKKGRLFAFMETIFTEFGYMNDKQIEKMVYNANLSNKNEIVSIYNKSIDFLETILYLPDNYFDSLKACSVEDFESRLFTPAMSIVTDEFSKLKNRGKNDLSSFLEKQAQKRAS